MREIHHPPVWLTTVRAAPVHVLASLGLLCRLDRPPSALGRASTSEASPEVLCRLTLLSSGNVRPATISQANLSRTREQKSGEPLSPWQTEDCCRGAVDRMSSSQASRGLLGKLRLSSGVVDCARISQASLGLLCRLGLSSVPRSNARAAIERAAVFSANSDCLARWSPRAAARPTSVSSADSGCLSCERGRRRREQQSSGPRSLLFSFRLSASALGHASRSQTRLGFLCTDSASADGWYPFTSAAFPRFPSSPPTYLYLVFIPHSSGLTP